MGCCWNGLSSVGCLSHPVIQHSAVLITCSEWQAHSSCCCCYSACPNLSRSYCTVLQVMAYKVFKSLGSGYINGVNCLAFSPDGACLASGQNNSVMVWDIHTGVGLHLIWTQSAIHLISWSTFYNQSVIVCGCRDGHIISIMIEKVIWFLRYLRLLIQS